ncbi:MAG: hypothetical protein R3E87_18130 [Burkholderiaceae bacterium]
MSGAIEAIRSIVNRTASKNLLPASRAAGQHGVLLSRSDPGCRRGTCRSQQIRMSRSQPMRSRLAGFDDAISYADRHWMQFEAERDLSPELVRIIGASGFFDVLVPKALGGLAQSLTTWFDHTEALARADGAAGWVAGHGALANALLVTGGDTRLTHAFMQADQPLAAWSNLPKVVARETDGGLRITGRWGFVSGCSHATWVGGAITLDASSQRAGRRTIAALAPRTQARIDRTWNLLGLEGSGSHDVCFDDVFVPWEHTFAWPVLEPNPAVQGTRHLAGIWFISMTAAAVALGLAGAALELLDDELAGKQNRLTAQPMRSNPALLRSIEKAEGVRHAGRSAVRSILHDIDVDADHGVQLPLEQRITAVRAAATAVRFSADVIRECVGMGGANALNRTHKLQKVLRDVVCLTQHISSNDAMFESLGLARAGDELMAARL